MSFANSSSLLTTMDSLTMSGQRVGETVLENVLEGPPMLIEGESFILSCLLSLFAVLFFLYFILNFLCFIGYCNNFKNELKGVKKVLLVIAHPDDECMFFGPTLTNLTATCDVYLICLSNGDYGGVGNIRSMELWMSCDKLGIKAGNIRLYKHPLLPDNPKSSWSPLLIGQIIIKFVETLSIDTLITFDAYGVSGHSNHSAIYRAVMHLSGKRAMPNYCKVYALESVNIIRKYSLCIDLLISYFTSQYLYITSLEKRSKIIDAMSQHSSQLLWYRRLFLIFSRYSYINTLKPIS